MENLTRLIFSTQTSGPMVFEYIDDLPYPLKLDDTWKLFWTLILAEIVVIGLTTEAVIIRDQSYKMFSITNANISTYFEGPISYRQVIHQMIGQSFN